MCVAKEKSLPLGGTLLEASGWSALVRVSLWPGVRGGGDHPASLCAVTALLQRLLVWNQLLKVSADVRAGFTSLCVRTEERQK